MFDRSRAFARLVVVPAWVAASLAFAEPPDGFSPPLRQMPAPKGRAAGGPIDVYVAPWCGFCRALEGDLRGRGIPFFRHDIEADAHAKREYVALGGEGLPLTKVGTQVVTGYDMPAILRLLPGAR